MLGSGTLVVGAVRRARYPIRGTLFVCCASALAQRAKSIAQSEKQKTLFFLGLLLLMPIACCLLRLFTESPYPLSPTHSAESPYFSILDFRLFDHRITLSALASTFGGIVRPICLAALRLMMNSNFVGCSTGKSSGFAPLRILSTKYASRENKRTLSTP